VNRGSVVIAAAPGDLTKKPRPYLVVQSDATGPAIATITLCPITSVLRDADMLRIPVGPSAENGLKIVSNIVVDQVTTLRKARIEGVVGRIDDATMAQVDVALRRWLDL
jgi:mRNA interferase MazF